MGIKRYTADQDNTITNAYKDGLTTRGVSGNMGESDIVEVFHIYGQASSSSMENSRILVQFPASSIATDRTSGLIPASGSVSFYLRLFNARHSQTTPRSFTLAVDAISASWQEGTGLDMENYSNIDESNWLYRSDTKINASASLTVRQNLFPYPINLTGTLSQYRFVSSNNATPPPNGFYIGADASACATNIAAIINESASADFSANAVNAVVYLTASTAGTAANTNRLSSSLASVFDITGSESTTNLGLSASFAGGYNFTKWKSEGGDYLTDSSSSFSQYFDTGFEDLEIDISPLVEQWISSSANSKDATNLGSKNNYGVGISLSGSLESATTSYYTKMFFARGSQYFFKRPIIEARWDSSKRDDRGNFYLSSSLVPAADNLMTLYLYNVVGGQLKNIPAVGTGDILVSIYSASEGNAPVGDALGLPIGGGVTTTGHTTVTGSFVETGIYSASFAYTSSAITSIVDVWHTGSTQYYSGSAIAVKTYAPPNYNFNQQYVSTVTNMRAEYHKETARLRLYTRVKDWSPNIYTVASKKIPVSIVKNTYYKITRISDNFAVVPLGTGSVNHTRLSYDLSGSYFDFDMSMLDTDTVYALNFTYLINGVYVDQPETFRFRVDK